MYFTRDGKEITVVEWARLMETYNYRVVAYNEFGEGQFVSTVWLGLDHSYGNGRILIFETLCSDGEMLRYSTEEEARAGHASHLVRLRAPTEVVKETFSPKRRVDLE